MAKLVRLWVVRGVVGVQTAKTSVLVSMADFVIQFTADVRARRDTMESDVRKSALMVSTGLGVKRNVLVKPAPRVIT